MQVAPEAPTPGEIAVRYSPSGVSWVYGWNLEYKGTHLLSREASQGEWTAVLGTPSSAWRWAPHEFPDYYVTQNRYGRLGLTVGARDDIGWSGDSPAVADYFMLDRRIEP